MDLATASTTSSYYSTSGTSKGDYRKATSIPYITADQRGRADTSATNIDADITVTSAKTGALDWNGTNGYPYHIATSIPYISQSYNGADSNTASNADSESTVGNITRVFHVHGGYTDQSYCKATSIPYPDWSEWHQAGKAVTASNADSDSCSTTGSYSAYNYFDASGATGYYRRATSIPYPCGTQGGANTSAASNADLDTTVNAERYLKTDYYNSDSRYPYRIATSIPYATYMVGTSYYEGLPTGAASNADSDVSVQGTRYIQNGNSGVSYRIATSIPYPIGSGCVKGNASNADSDSEYSSESYSTGSSGGNFTYRKATSIPYINNDYRDIPGSAASNADSDVTNSNVTRYISTGSVSSGNYRRATSIPYPYYNSSSVAGIPESTASNADFDSTYSSDRYIRTDWSTNGVYDYRKATSIPYVTGSNDGLSDTAASNADSDTTASKCNAYINAYGGTHSYVNRRATSIPYPSSSYNGRPDATANNVDVDTNTGSTQYRWETAYNASGAYQYRRATALTYLGDNTDSRTVAGRCHEKNSRYILREFFSII